MAKTPMFAVAERAAASLKPYPYVLVEEDGSVRELHGEERKYLETPFSPFDGARPYVKSDYESRDGSKSIKGFCPRMKIPDGLLIADAPDHNPMPKLSKADLVELLKKKMSDGFEVTEQPGGALIAKRLKGK